MKLIIQFFPKTMREPGGRWGSPAAAPPSQPKF